MRKDAKVLFAVGGVLLAVLVVYFVSTSKKKTTTTNPPSVAVVPPEQPSVQPPGSTDNGLGAGASGAGTGGGIAGPNDSQPVQPVTPTEQSKKLTAPDNVVPPGVLPPEKPFGDPGKIEKPAEPPVGPLDVVAKPRTTGSFYIVKANQTLSTISLERYGTVRHWIEIQAANPGINPNRMHVGDKLNLPDIAVASRPAGSGGSGGSASEDLNPEHVHVIPPADLDTVLAADTHISTHETPAPAPSGGLPVPGQVYHVRPGDSLYKISKLAYHSGKHADAIYDANKAAIGPDKARLKLDMALTIPDGDRHEK
jgi:nucleoid-associated protein YgaU